MITNFPVGFHNFHKDEGLNFQLNRFYASGILSYDEVNDIGNRVTGFDVWIKLFLELAEKAKAQGDMEKCAICYRAAQFYTLGNEKDKSGKLMKVVLYEKCFEAYAEAYKDIKYERVPFKSGYLPVYIMKHSENSKGVIVMHGGYDSFMQEFVRYAMYLYEAGYDVYLFEGAGQGEVLCRCNIKMTPQWESSVSTVLDYYNLTDVTLIGISLGGYLATHAAAYEPRIKRLVMYDLIYDFYGSIVGRLGKIGRKLLDYLTERPQHFMWKFVGNRLNRIYFANWLFEQGYYIFENVSTPCEYFNCIKEYNTRTLSEMITQDTLVMAGSSDLYTIYLEDQIKALTNAKSVESRLFTEDEHAHQHCQVGNLKLALDVIIDWIERVEKNA